MPRPEVLARGQGCVGEAATRVSTEGAQIFTVAEGVPGDPLWNSEPLRA